MKKAIVIIVFLCSIIAAFAQNRAIDSTMVTFHPSNFDSISLKTPHFLDTTTFNANEFDPLSNNYTLYSTLSNIGLAHHPMQFQTKNNIGFDMELPAFEKYIKTEKDLKTYLSLLPYSKINYVMTTGDKEQHLNFQFGRQIYQGLYLSFEINNNSSPGIYTNNKANNNYIWVNLLYTTQDQRYRALAYWYRNKIDVQENGGIKIDSVYTQQLEGDNSVILTNLTNSSNYIKVSGAGFQHYFNLLPQHKTTTSHPTDSLRITADTLSIPIDTVVERRFTLGRINHSFAYQRNQLFYNETSSALPFYATFDTVFAANTTDTTIVHRFHNSIYWNTLGYQNYSDNVPFYLCGGIDYDFYRHQYYDYLEAQSINDQNHSQVSLNGSLIINLFRSTTLTANVRFITLGYQIGDFNIKGQWRQYLGTKERNLGKLVFNLDMKRQSPSWFEASYHSNHFRWENDFHAATHLCIGASYHYKFFGAGVKSTSINDLIYFNQEARPAQHDGLVNITEVYGNLDFNWWRFKINGMVSLQKASNENVIHLPLLLSRLKIGYSQPIFKKAATLQPSITVQYFTKYYADAYMPALRTFYLQNDVRIGNFPFIDLALAINVKQADLYVQYSNMFLLTGNHDSFIAPHYPMRDSRIFIGINWRLFN